MFRKERRSVPQLNTTSTADISFMLLILFLVTTSMDIDKGLSRQLPPLDPVMEQQPTDVEEGQVLRLKIEADNNLTCEGEPLLLSQLRKRVEDFVTKRGKDHILQLESSPQASYDVYFNVQNEIVAAYSALRDAQARMRFGKSFSRCSEEERNVLREAVPQRVSEVYPQEEGGEP